MSCWNKRSTESGRVRSIFGGRQTLLGFWLVLSSRLGISACIRHQIRCAVCRCFRGAVGGVKDGRRDAVTITKDTELPALASVRHLKGRDVARAVQISNLRLAN